MVETILYCILAFCTAFCSDVFWMLYSGRASKNHRVMASNYAVGIGLMFILTYDILDYKNWLYRICYLVGLWLGTYCAPSIEKFFIDTWKETKVEQLLKNKNITIKKREDM